MNIGKLQKVNPRDLWPHEEYDLSLWLSENLDVLSEKLELRLTLEEREKKVGSFELDILATGDNGEIVIIENQFGKTNHDHLGKVLTYLSNLDAAVAVWVCESFNDAHKIAIDWLNENSPSTVGFYLVQLEAVSINGSDAAPLFTVISAPNETAKSVGAEKRELADRHYKRKDFWTLLLDKAKTKTSLFSGRTPGVDHWLGAGIGKTGLSLNLILAKSWGGVEVYFDKGKDSQEINKARFDYLFAHKDDIERKFGGELAWERLDQKRASRIAYRNKTFGLANEDSWDQLQESMIDAAIRLHTAMKDYINKLPS